MQKSRKKEKPLANVIFVDLLDPHHGTVRGSDTSEAGSSREGPNTGPEAPPSTLVGGLTSSLRFVPSPWVQATSTAITRASPPGLSSTRPPYPEISRSNSLCWVKQNGACVLTRTGHKRSGLWLEGAFLNPSASGECRCLVFWVPMRPLVILEWACLCVRPVLPLGASGQLQHPADGWWDGPPVQTRGHMGSLSWRVRMQQTRR